MFFGAVTEMQMATLKQTRAIRLAEIVHKQKKDEAMRKVKEEYKKMAEKVVE